MANIGDLVLYQWSSSRYHWAIVAGNISGSTADLCVFSDGSTWENGAMPDNVSYMRYAKDQGSGVDEWLPNTAVFSSILGSDTLKLGSVSTPTRSLGTPFQPHASRPTLCSYSGRIVSALTLAGGAAGRIELRSDASNPPTTVRARVAGGSTGTVVVGVSMSDTVESPLVYLVRPADFVLLQSVNETGTPSYSLGAQYEITL